MLMDPRTLDTIAMRPLPPRIPTTTGHLFVVAVLGDGFVQERDYDLTGAVPVGDKIISALPDWSGRYWFASTNGVMGTVDPASGAVRSIPLGEDISNSFAVDDSGGLYVVTQKVRRAGFYLGRKRVARDRRAPFRKRVTRRHRGRAHPHRISARVRMKDGRRVILRKRFRACGERRR